MKQTMGLLMFANLFAGILPGSTSLKPGQMAPDFTLKDTEGRTVKLSDFRGKQNVVVAFFPKAFTSG